MRKFFVQFKRELAFYFRNPLGYILLFCHLFVVGFNFHFSVSALNMTTSRINLLEAFFNTVLFWFPFILIVPIITMRLFSEEYKLGTIELLLTSPIRDIEIILSKYLAACSFFVILWMPSGFYFLLFWIYTGIKPAEAPGAFVGAYTMLMLQGFFYISIGLLSSIITRNQIVAATLAFVFICCVFFIGLITYLIPNPSVELRDLTSYFSAIEHMADFSKGYFNTRPILFYISSILFVLYFCFHLFQTRRLI
ncbi:MAG: ABC transporter permease [Chthoniobacterales bacterium]|nr:ABC transporter permease [Chthoniobacterales bacterium]